jgi:CheY-like chemotaxis protein
MINILLIEDEVLIQRSLKRMLEQRGAQVDAVSSGKQAIELILTRDFDRIICDLMLQDITGFDIIEESRKKFTPEEISNKFVIITAYSSPHVLDRASTYRCPILAKPFEDLGKAIDNFLTLEPGKKIAPH